VNAWRHPRRPRLHRLRAADLPALDRNDFERLERSNDPDVY